MNVSSDLMCRIHNLLCDIAESRHDDRRYYAPRLDADRVDEIADDVAGYLGEEWEAPTPAPSGEACSDCDGLGVHRLVELDGVAYGGDDCETCNGTGTVSRAEV